MSEPLSQMAQNFTNNLQQLGPQKHNETTATRRQQEKAREQQRQLMAQFEKRIKQAAAYNPNAATMEGLKKAAADANLPFGNYPMVRAIRHALMSTGYRLGLA